MRWIYRRNSLGISRPGDSGFQRVAYSGHKRKYALKNQAVAAPDGLILHVSGPIQGRRHDWTIYARSGLEAQLGSNLFVDGKQYYL